jgi:hypothetical protein
MIDPEIVVEQIVVNPDNTRYSYFSPLVVWELVVWSFGDVPKRLDDESPKPLRGAGYQ